jgi:hypothetical protein
MFLATVHAGPLLGPATTRWFFDGGVQTDAGATDRVELSLGASLVLELPPVAQVICDAPIVDAELLDQGLRFKALDAGITLCGVWLVGPYRHVPNRLVDVSARPLPPM